ncbi:flagellar hook protein FlgE [Kiloniella antarctica]|uniref:Flagellar hook protein FlgE n=1 Tax=Kiloniella antarctica TaxID=1550907 RepID=A0ABW5BQX1_9PROT
MSIYGALYAGVSGLNAQSNAMGMISDNIANVNTIGYKGVSARFSTLVAQSASATQYASGGVRSAPLSNIDKQGQLQGTASGTDLAVAGRGFFVVSDRPATGTSTQYLFSRAGSFRPDAAGNLVNAGGYYLQGWSITPGASTPTSGSTFTGLDTVNISNLNGSARATTNLSIDLNLPSTALATAQTSDVLMEVNLDNTALTGATHDVNLTVYDETNTAQAVTYRWTKLAAANQWSIEALPPGGGTVTNGGPTTVVFDPVTGRPTSGFPPPNPLYAWSNGSSSSVDIASFGAGITETAAASASSSQQYNDQYVATTQILDDLGNTHDMNIAFTKTAANTWDVTVLNPTLNGVESGVVTGLPRSINFSGGTPSLINLPPITIDWSTGSTGATNSTITLDGGTIGGADGIIQFSGSFIVNGTEQDGVSFGNFRGVSINEEGVVTALFDNGEQLDIAQIPLAMFPNPNGLEARTGNAYSATSDSGNFILNRPKIGGAGLIASSSLEASNIDLAEEFTNMIVTQRAYSASSKIITTADEMLDELIRIVR